METTRTILIGVVIAAIAFFIGKCATDGPDGLTAEEKFLKKYALLDDGETMIQTVTRFQKDAAIQKLFLSARYSNSSNGALDSLYSLDISEETSLRDRARVFEAMDLQYTNRLENILSKKSGRTTMLLPNPAFNGSLKLCPCPQEEDASDDSIGDYCVWKEKDFMPIIVDTSLWNVQQILIEEINISTNTNGNLIANSTHVDTKKTSSPGSTYVLYELFNQVGTIPPGTFVLFTVKWTDSQNNLVSSKLILQVAATVSSN